MMFAKANWAIVGCWPVSLLLLPEWSFQNGILMILFTMTAVANLTLNNKYFQRVVPNDQSFDKDEYAGKLSRE